jgi:coproporphyrinogen III oxidase-like Fe-S oxidoreductase
MGFPMNEPITVFDVGLRPGDDEHRFTRQLPVFNWFYPFDRGTAEPNTLAALAANDWSAIRRIAVYFHIPFCDTICSFCPFVRGHYKTDQDIEAYLEALLREIQLKHPYVGALSADSMFIGGGTPSVLSPEQIVRLGSYIDTYFDTSKITEFAVEVEVKSVTYEKLLAFRRIGVNRISFGAQTFAERYRAAFALDATVSQIARVAEWANDLFPYTNVDIIYGIAGQDLDDVLSDADQAIELGTTSIDFYPLNNLSAQIRMHRALDSAGMQRPTAAQRLNHRRMLREHMLSRNYARINGYGYARRRGRSNDMIERKPKFLYHDILYGYGNDAVIGYGASAVTQIPGYNMYNAASRTRYRDILVDQSSLPCTAYRTAGSPGKGVVTFPYRGSLEKSMVPWDSVSSEVLASLDELLRAGLMTETNMTFEVSETGWLYYVNMMYCLMPKDDKQWISEQIASLVAAGRECESTALVEL